MRTDAELVTDALSGDLEAFGILVGRYERLVRATALHVCKDKHAAEDVAQEAFLAAFESLDTLRRAEKFGGWLLSIAKYKAARCVRAGRRREQTVPDLESCQALGNGRLSRQSEHLLSLVERLPDHERIVVGLRHFERRSVQDVADILGQPVGTITKQLPAPTKDSGNGPRGVRQMNTHETVVEQLDQLGLEIGSSPESTQRILDQLEARLPAIQERRRSRRRVGPSAKVGLAAATIVLCVLAWWLWRPASVYARMLEALAKADTVHTTGWTRELVRRWPLEKPAPEQNIPAKHAIDAWFWNEPDGTPRSYARRGAVVLIRRGGESREYQADADLTYVYTGGHSKDGVSRFMQLGEYLALLQRPSLKKRDLGTRNEDGRIVRGIRHIEGDRIDDVWIDEKSGLPRRFERMNRRSGERLMEMFFAVNEKVPDAISNYEPPKTQNVRYGGPHENTNLAWRQYVQTMGARLQQAPINRQAALLRREHGKTFANQWPLQTPDGKYWVVPLDRDQHEPMDLSHFIRLRAAAKGGELRHGTWRVPREFHDFIIPRSDLVYADGTPWQEWLSVVLSQFDLECVDQPETRTAWIARHDGRPLKPWQRVAPPVPYVVEGGVEMKGYVRPGIGAKLRPAPLHELFADFNVFIDHQDLAADKPWIVNKTGLPHPPAYNKDEHGTYQDYRKNVVEPEFLVATDSPWFAGDESLQLARDWYLKEFGITFEEVEQPVTVHVIRRKR